ncbi:uncharacterized protein [Anabrus simplex]|uniref:uncharacterized protein n=1 Tax=Anabrus simplex TaxID=316456 RepID=UPI0034DD5C2D
MKSFVLVAVLLAVCHYVPTSAYSRNRSVRIDGNMDYYFDSLVVKLSHFFQNNGLDPLAIPDIGQSFSFKDLIGVTWHGELMLKEVSLSGLSMLHRSGHATLGYGQKLLDIQVELGFDDCKLDGDFVAEIMNIGPRGQVVGDIKNLKIYLHLKFDVDTMEIILDDLKITDAGKVDLTVHGPIGILDLLVDTIADVVTTLFHDVVVQIVAKEVRSVVEKSLSEINIDCMITGGTNCTTIGY